MAFRPLTIIAGAFAALGISAASHAAFAPGFMADLETRAAEAAGGEVELRFRTRDGYYSRHPEIAGAASLHPDARKELARRIDRIDGVGGPHWRDERRRQVTKASNEDPLHCERSVQAILKTRTIRFAEGSATLDPVSTGLLNEVAEALRPCVGGRIAIIGHTNNVGDPEANRQLSERRAERVRDALAERDIPARDFVIEGKGSTEPVEGLDPADPANRRIEFELLQKAPLVPTPVDTPGAG